MPHITMVIDTFLLITLQCATDAALHLYCEPSICIHALKTATNLRPSPNWADKARVSPADTQRASVTETSNVYLLILLCASIVVCSPNSLLPNSRGLTLPPPLPFGGCQRCSFLFRAQVRVVVESVPLANTDATTAGLLMCPVGASAATLVTDSDPLTPSARQILRAATQGSQTAGRLQTHLLLLHDRRHGACCQGPGAERPPDAGWSSLPSPAQMGDTNEIDALQQLGSGA